MLREPRLQLGSLGRGAELVDVLLPHAGEPVEPVGTPRADAGEAGRGPAASREQGGARDRARPAAGPAQRHEVVSADGVEHGRGVGDVVGQGAGFKQILLFRPL